MSTKKENKVSRFNLKHLVLCGVALVFAVYSVISLVSLYSQIGQKKSELESINAQIEVQELKNEEMSELYNSSDEEFSRYIERIAREDLDYIKEGERVFVNVAGD